MLRITLFLLAIQACGAAAAGPYTIAEPCYPAQCNATVLNDRAEIAGQFFTLASTAMDGRGFEATVNGFIAPLIGDTNSYVLPRGINTAGALAVEYGPYNATSIAGVYSPESRTLLNLNAVMGWSSASRAVTINDSGDVAAFDRTSAIFFPTIIPASRGCPCTGIPFAITNNREVIFMEKSNDKTNPNGLWYVANSTATLALRAPPVSVSTAGHILLREEFTIPNYYIEVPGSAEKAVSLGDAQPFAINNSDQFLVHRLEGDAIWDGVSAPRLLQALVPPDSMWKILRGRAINNAGQILVDADNGTRLTSLVLSPPVVQTPAGSNAAVPGVRSINGRSVEIQ
jgi:hypothetical protein